MCERAYIIQGQGQSEWCHSFAKHQSIRHGCITHARFSDMARSPDRALILRWKLRLERTGIWSRRSMTCSLQRAKSWREQFGVCLLLSTNHTTLHVFNKKWRNRKTFHKFFKIFINWLEGSDNTLIYLTSWQSPLKINSIVQSSRYF